MVFLSFFSLNTFAGEVIINQSQRLINKQVFEQKQYLIYRCGKALFYKGYEFNGFIKYRPLTNTEALKLKPH